MKLSKLTLACLLATSGLSVTSGANAEVTQEFGFHGSFRAGVLTSDNDDYQRYPWGATKEMVGRLGIEGDNDFGVSLSNKWTFENEQSVKLTVDVVEEENGISATNFPGAFIEYQGISETGTIWGGKRDYKKGENYIFMTDFFYVDYSGTGIGIDGYEIGDTKLSLAYTASDRAGNVDSEADRLMHAVIFGAENGAFKVDTAAKYMNDNRSFDNGSYTYYTETGFDISATYSMEDFFGLPGNGFSKIIAQAGVGLGANQLLAGTLGTYNAWRPGSLQIAGPDQIANNNDDDTSARLLLWGGYFLDNGINLFPALQAQYNDHETGGYDYWMSAMVRPTFPVNDNFYIQSELGYAYKNNNGSSSIEQKLTVGPTFVINTGVGPAPEVRFLASYLPQQDDKVLFGVQADVWW